MVVDQSGGPALSRPTSTGPPRAGQDPLVRMRVRRRTGGDPAAFARFPWGEDASGWITSIARRRRRGRPGRDCTDGPPDPDSAGRSGVGADPRAVGDARGYSPASALGCSSAHWSRPVTFRAPGITAKAAATLDVLSGGRAFSGSVPAGGSASTRRTACASRPRRSASTTGGRDRDVRALWASGTKPYEGERVSLPETTCYPRPVGDIPIIVGGSGEQRTLRIAARLADVATCPPTPTSSIASSPCSAGTAPTSAATQPTSDHRLGPADHRHRPRRYRAPGGEAARAYVRRHLRGAPPRRDGGRPPTPLRRPGRPRSVNGLRRTTRPRRRRTTSTGWRRWSPGLEPDPSPGPR